MRFPRRHELPKRKEQPAPCDAGCSVFQRRDYCRLLSSKIGWYPIPTVFPLNAVRFPEMS